MANLDSQIQMQMESVKTKEAKIKEIRDKLDQVLLSTYHDLD